MKKFIETNTDIYMALLQVRSTPVGPCLPSLAAQLFNKPARDLLPKFSRPPMLFDNDESTAAPIKRQLNVGIDTDIHENILILYPQDQL